MHAHHYVGEDTQKFGPALLEGLAQMGIVRKACFSDRAGVMLAQRNLARGRALDQQRAMVAQGRVTIQIGMYEG